METKGRPSTIWIPPRELAVVDSAAEQSGVSRSRFVRDAAVRLARAVCQADGDDDPEAA